MNLLTLTSAEFETALQHSPGVILPIGSIEQHGPMGLLGCDALCAETVALEAGRLGNILVAPVLAYTSSQFNMSFPGTISIRSRTVMSLIEDIVDSLQRQGVKGVYFLNAHGANIAPIRAAMHDIYSRLGDSAPIIRCKSWWDFEQVNAIRRGEFGEWEGMHATPSEISITQRFHRIPDVTPPSQPASSLAESYIRDHAGDFHPPANRHKAEFPDGRVGSDSALATPEHGAEIVAAAANALIADFRRFMADI
ncbi:MAG: creatininase family protein [Woeseia sp.]